VEVIVAVASEHLVHPRGTEDLFVVGVSGPCESGDAVEVSGCPGDLSFIIACVAEVICLKELKGFLVVFVLVLVVVLLLLDGDGAQSTGLAGDLRGAFGV